MVVNTYHSRLASMQDYELAVMVKPSVVAMRHWISYSLSWNINFVPERESFFLKLRIGASWRYFDSNNDQRAEFTALPLGLSSV